MAVSKDVQYDQVTQQVRYHNEKMIEAFNLFIKLYSAVIGGAIWFSLQPGISAVKSLRYAHISDGLAILISIVCSLSLLENLRAWHGYRFAQHRLDSSIPAPRRYRASVVELVMSGVMIASAILFWAFNPLTI